MSNISSRATAKAIRWDPLSRARAGPLGFKALPPLYLLAVAEFEQMQLFTLDMVDLPLGEVYDSAGRKFNSAPLCRDAIHDRLIGTAVIESDYLEESA